MNEPPKEAVKYVDANVHLPYHYVAGDYRARYLRALKDKKILGSKCSKTGKVFVPPLVSSPESFAPCDEFVEVADRGVVTTFCIVNIPVIGRNLETALRRRLGGARRRRHLDLRARSRSASPRTCAWACASRRCGSPTASARATTRTSCYFRPTGEPDAPLESFIHRL